MSKDTSKGSEKKIRRKKKGLGVVEGDTSYNNTSTLEVLREMDWLLSGQHRSKDNPNAGKCKKKKEKKNCKTHHL